MSESQPAMQLTLLDWRPMKRNSLRGFATVRLGKAFKISDIVIHCNSGKRWASLPSKPQVDGNGVAVKDERGKIKYLPVVSWMDKDSSDRFSVAVIEAVEREYPGATQGDA